MRAHAEDRTPPLKRIAIIGGGFAGATLVRRLARRLPEG